MLYRAQLRDTAAAQLVAANTLAGANVFVPRDWPTNPGTYPAILVQAYREREDSRGHSQVPQFIAVARLSVVGRLQAGTAALAESQLDQFCEQIRLAVLTCQAILQNVSRIAYVETDMGVSAEGRQHIGEVQIDFGLEYSVDIDPIGQSPVGPSAAVSFQTVTTAIKEPAGTTQPSQTFSLPQ